MTTQSHQSTRCHTACVSRRTAIGLAGLGAAAALVGAGQPRETDQRVVVLVRHAEKQTGDDPELTEAGHARAGRVGRLLASAGVVGVWHTPYRRTEQTAQAVADACDAKLHGYNARDPSAMIKALPARGVVVIVGHSNTIPDLVRMLGGDPKVEQLEDDAYSDVFVVVGTGLTLLLQS